MAEQFELRLYFNNEAQYRRNFVSPVNAFAGLVTGMDFDGRPFGLGAVFKIVGTLWTFYERNGSRTYVTGVRLIQGNATTYFSDTNPVPWPWDENEKASESISAS